MQAALDVAAYALGATVLAGVFLLGWLAYELRFSDRFRTPHPQYVRLPCTALDAAREVYERLKTAYSGATAQERHYLDLHLRRMEERVQHLEDKTFDEHAPYYKAVGRREKLWQRWKALHEQVRHMPRADRRRARHLLDEAASSYRKRDQGVREEWERGLYRDQVMLEELRSLGLLDEGFVPKLLERVRAHTAGSVPEEEDLDRPGAAQEPGADARGERPGPEGSAVAEPPPAGQRRGVGLLSYNRIREALAPLFGKKAPRPQNLAQIPAQGPDIPPSDWKPAPPPPRVEPAPQGEAQRAETAAAPSAALAVPPAAGARPAASPAAPALLRQQDLLGSGLAAPGRRYTDAAFSVAGLPRGILRQADLNRSRFTGVFFSGRHRYLDCRFAGADLSAIQLEPQARAHQFVRCDFTGAQFAGSRLGFALFHECNLSGTRWSGARLERVRFSECVLDGVEWDGAEFIETRIASMARSVEQPASAVPEPPPSGSAAAKSAEAEPAEVEPAAAEPAEAETVVVEPVQPADRPAPAGTPR